MGKLIQLVDDLIKAIAVAIIGLIAVGAFIGGLSVLRFIFTK